MSHLGVLFVEGMREGGAAYGRLDSHVEEGCTIV
jgi:hypothetical protein